MSGESMWVVLARDIVRGGFRATHVCAANPCSSRPGWSKTIIDYPTLRYIGFGYERRVLLAIGACQAWCEEENRKELLR